MVLGPFHPDSPELYGLKRQTGGETYERQGAFCIRSEDFPKRIKHVLRQDHGIHKSHQIAGAFVVLFLAKFEEFFTIKKSADRSLFGTDSDDHVDGKPYDQSTHLDPSKSIYAFDTSPRVLYRLVRNARVNTSIVRREEAFARRQSASS